MTFAPGTPVEGSSDPRTVEQNAAIRRMQTESGAVGSQYSGCIILPDGTVTRDQTVIVKPPARVQEITNVLNAAGKPVTINHGDGTTSQGVSGGYLLILNTEGIPVQYYPVSSSEVQTRKEQVIGSAISPSEAAQGYSRKTAIVLAMTGVQTDGTPVTDSYLQLMERWAAQEGIPFTRPSQDVIAAMNRPAPAAVVLGSNQGISAVQVAPPVIYAAPQPAAPMQTPTFTQGATIPEDFTPAPLRVQTTPPAQESAVPFKTLVAADTTTAPATSPMQDASVQAADNRMKYLAVAAVVAVLLAMASRKG